MPNPFRGRTSHHDLAHRKALVPTCRLSFSGSYVCMYIMLFVKGYPNFMDLTLCTTTTVENQQHTCILFHTAGGKKRTYTCCSVHFYSQSVTIRTKKQSTCRVILHLITALKLPRKETCLQRYVHIEEGEQAMSFPVKHGNSQCV